MHTECSEENWWADDNPYGLQIHIHVLLSTFVYIQDMYEPAYILYIYI